MDTTNPVIQFTGNEGIYPIDAKIAIFCSAEDELSGIASANCPSQEGLSYTFGWVFIN
ncbi:hypothetical protein [Neobacillus vireti]|uniref:hypothetical protein n=1 Tax=Neobacillus vireti TaxID=220686 RepID=UPI00300033CA